MPASFPKNVQAVFVAVAGHRLSPVDRDRALPIAEEIWRASRFLEICGRRNQADVARIAGRKLASHLLLEPVTCPARQQARDVRGAAPEHGRLLVSLGHALHAPIIENHDTAIS